MRQTLKVTNILEDKRTRGTNVLVRQTLKVTNKLEDKRTRVTNVLAGHELSTILFESFKN